MNSWQPFQKALWPFCLACMYMDQKAFFCCCSSAFSTTSMLIDRRSAILLSSALVLRTAERSLGMAKVMMTARPFLVPGRPCLLAPVASTWLDSLPRTSFTLANKSSSASALPSSNPVHLREQEVSLSRGTEPGAAAVFCKLSFWSSAFSE